MADKSQKSIRSPPGLEEATECPVDHSTRAAWLDANKAQSISPSATCDSATMDQTLSTPTIGTPAGGLKTEREVSTIPRVGVSNGNVETPVEKSASGNWIYPSEEMFFKAMARKNWDPKAEDMRAIVPIHNAVNERAWKDIKEWEKGRGSEKCGGPKLISFSGDSKKLTPKARMYTLLGYHAPFDRHDWVIDRCGKHVEYVIDFYSGKQDPTKPGIPSFYLDVRPKVSVEGVWMRTQKWVGGFF